MTNGNILDALAALQMGVWGHLQSVWHIFTRQLHQHEEKAAPGCFQESWWMAPFIVESFISADMNLQRAKIIITLNLIRGFSVCLATQPIDHSGVQINANVIRILLIPKLKTEVLKRLIDRVRMSNNKTVIFPVNNNKDNLYYVQRIFYSSQWVYLFQDCYQW